MDNSFRKKVWYAQFQPAAEPQDLLRLKTFTFIIFQVFHHCVERHTTELSSYCLEGHQPHALLGQQGQAATQCSRSRSSSIVSLYTWKIFAAKALQQCTARRSSCCLDFWYLLGEPQTLVQGCPRGGGVLENPLELHSWALFSGSIAGVIFGQCALACLWGWRGRCPCAV